ncbi:MAG: MXAN_5187 C-terminal domain-containing protein, partial [Myxococcota bacterium]
MGFWLRHFLLFLLVVAAPVAVALWIDAETAVEQAKEAGLRAVSRAASALSSQIELSVRGRLDDAVAAAHDLVDQSVLDAVERSGRRRDEALALVEKRLTSVRPDGGFAWLVGSDGRILSGEDEAQDPRDVSGHPLVVQARFGVVGDMLWRHGDPPVWAAAAPLVQDGRAAGAVIVGWPIDPIFVSSLARQLDVSLTLMSGSEFVATSLEGEQVRSVVDPALAATGPVVAGELPTPLSSPVPGLPLVLGPRADGLAYASQSVPVPGGGLQWVVSINNAAPLQAMAGRQINLLAGGLALAMVVLLFSIVAHRTHVAPIRIISEHLSEIQLGRGEVELPEPLVSHPFRRLVRLINMTVQKLPARGLTGVTGSLPAIRTAGRTMDVQGPEPSRERRITESSPGPSDVSVDIASAIAALDATTPPSREGGSLSNDAVQATLPTTPPPKKSASGIRGGRPNAELALDDEFHEISQFSIPPGGPRGGSTRGGIRGGGSLDLGGSVGITPEGAEKLGEPTAVQPVAEELLAQTIETGPVVEESKEDMTVVATVDPKLLSQTVEGNVDGDGLDETDLMHFKEVYENFLQMRRQCGEQTKDVAFERFQKKLKKNRAKLIDK